MVRRILGGLVVLGLCVSACSNSGSSGTGAAKSAGGNGTGPAGAASLFGAKDLNAPQHVGTPKRGGDLTFGLESDILDVSPAKSIVQPSDRALATAVFDPLVSFDAHGQPVTDNTDHKVDQLADEVTHPAGDLATWTVHVRKGIEFSNGKPLTAAEIVSHTKWVQAGGVCACKESAAEISSLDTGTDDQGRATVTYHLSSPVVDWPDKIATTGLGWITESGARGTDTNPDLTTDHLVGTGPFVFGKHSGDTYKVVKNPHYYGVDPVNGQQLPYLDSIEFKPLSDSVTRLQAVSSGGVQIMQTADTSNLVGAQKDSNLRIQPIQGTSSTIQVLNLTHEPFGVKPKPGETAQTTAQRSLDDPTAHKARLAYEVSINRSEINQKYYQGTRVPAYGFLPLTNPYFSAKGQLPRYDPIQAKKLVAQVKAAGVSMKLKTMCINTPEASSVHQIMAAQQEAVGITSVQKQVDQATLVRTMLSGGTSAVWDVACFRSGQFADPDGLYSRFHTGGSLNLAKYSRAKVDQWLEAGRTHADVSYRKSVYDKVQIQTAADVVYVPLLFDLFGNVHSDKISGLSLPDPTSLGTIRPGELYYIGS